MKPQLIVLLGPTGVGKTELSLSLAEFLHSPILNADSRQLFRDLPIGTAAPTQEQLLRVKHYFVGILNLTDYYSAAQYETDVLRLLPELYTQRHCALLSGGSMMYIDAVCKGIDDIPTVLPEVREAAWRDYEEKGLDYLLEELKRVDPVHYDQVDRNNYKRVVHAIEICRQAGVPYSSLRTNQPKQRDFRIIQVGLTREREELCDRINRRVDQMMADGLLEEARQVYPFRHLNSLNTVGYKELFNYFDGTWTLEMAVEKIKRDSRVYARKQMTWFRRDPRITWFHPDQERKIFSFLEDQINSGHQEEAG